MEFFGVIITYLRLEIGGGTMIIRPDYIEAIKPFIDVPFVKILAVYLKML